MMLRTMDEGDQPDAIHICSAAASGDPLIAPPDVALPNVNMAQYGDPFAKVGPPSNGPAPAPAWGVARTALRRSAGTSGPITLNRWIIRSGRSIGQVEKSAAICIEVDPKGSPDLGPFFNVSYSLTVNPAVQFRIIVDEEEKVPPSRPNTSATGTFSLQRGKHTVEVVVRVPGESVRLAMLLRTKETGDSPEAVRLCGAEAAPPVSPGVRAAVIYKVEAEQSKEYLATKGEVKATAKLEFTVGVDGKAHDIRVIRSAGMGLDRRRSELFRSGSSGPRRLMVGRFPRLIQPNSTGISCEQAVGLGHPAEPSSNSATRAGIHKRGTASANPDRVRSSRQTGPPEGRFSNAG